MKHILNYILFKKFGNRKVLFCVPAPLPSGMNNWMPLEGRLEGCDVIRWWSALPFSNTAKVRQHIVVSERLGSWSCLASRPRGIMQTWSTRKQDFRLHYLKNWDARLSLWKNISGGSASYTTRYPSSRVWCSTEEVGKWLATWQMLKEQEIRKKTSQRTLFMVVGITINIKMSIGFFPTRTAATDQLFSQLWKATGLLEWVSNLRVISKPFLVLTLL